MRSFAYLFVGVLLGVILYKSEAASWFRIYEMFEFGSFHMYGIIGSAVVCGALGVYFMKRNEVKSIDDQELQLKPKQKSVPRYLIGGILFGLGWALVGACPGPMFILIGAGYWTVLVVLAGAVLGTLAYGLIRARLPH